MSKTTPISLHRVKKKQPHASFSSSQLKLLPSRLLHWKMGKPQTHPLWFSYWSPRLPGRPAWGADGYGDGEHGALHYDAAAKALRRNIPGRQWKAAQLPGRPDRDGERSHHLLHFYSIKTQISLYFCRANESRAFTVFLDNTLSECACVLLTHALLPSRRWRKARATKRKPCRLSTPAPTKCFSISCLNREIPKKRRRASPGRYGPS